MSLPLETRINPSNVFRSAGEREIAEVLTRYGLPFKYESPLLVQDNQEKPRIWYPDFYLPTHGMYVEYYGLRGSPNYDSIRLKKEQVYRDMRLEVIAIDPSVPDHKLDSYLINQIYRVQAKRYQGIKSIVYDLRTRNKPKH